VGAGPEREEVARKKVFTAETQRRGEEEENKVKI
jgi:hypothetical protein